MKAELVRTDEENERYRQLVETNRQRRRQLLHQQQSDNPTSIPQVISSFLFEKESNFISLMMFFFYQLNKYFHLYLEHDYTN